jgi:hypothetical protein
MIIKYKNGDLNFVCQGFNTFLQPKPQYTDIWLHITSNIKIHTVKDIALQLKHVNWAPPTKTVIF